jgi:hypothetical protein
MKPLREVVANAPTRANVFWNITYKARIVIYNQVNDTILDLAYLVREETFKISFIFEKI